MSSVQNGTESFPSLQQGDEEEEKDEDEKGMSDSPPATTPSWGDAHLLRNKIYADPKSKDFLFPELSSSAEVPTSPTNPNGKPLNASSPGWVTLSKESPPHGGNKWGSNNKPANNGNNQAPQQVAQNQQQQKKKGRGQLMFSI